VLRIVATSSVYPRGTMFSAGEPLAPGRDNDRLPGVVAPYAYAQVVVLWDYLGFGNLHDGETATALRHFAEEPHVTVNNVQATLVHDEHRLALGPRILARVGECSDPKIADEGHG
jgi:hypothetical protein